MEVTGTGTGVARRVRALGPTLRADRYALLCCGLICLLPAVLWRSGLSVGVYIKYAAGILVCFLLPGLAITQRLRLALHSEGLLVVSLGLGLAASNLGYTVACYARLPWLYLLLPLGSLLWLVRAARRASPARAPRLALLPRLLIWLVVLTAASLLTRMPVHALDFTPAAHGGLNLVVPPDGTLHTAIINELLHTFPPRNPFAPDRALSYHYANELSAVVLCKFFQLPASSVCLRLLPTFFVAYAILAVYVLVRRLTGSLPAALVTPLLILLGEDFSFVPGLMTGSAGVWAGEYFSSPSVFGLYFVNPNLPGLAIFFGAMWAFLRALGAGPERRVWIGVAGTLFALAASYKIFFGIQSAAALGIAWLCCRGQRRRFVLELGVATVVGCLVLMLPGALARARADMITIVPTLYTAYIPTALNKLTLASHGWCAALTQMFSSHRPTPAGLAELLLVGLPLFVIGTLGARLLGILRLIEAVRRPSSAHQALQFLGLFVIVGYVLGLGSKVTPREFPDAYNNSVWFLVESKLVAWVFVALVIGKLFKTWSPRRAAWLSVVQIGLLAVPASINTFLVGANNGAPTIATKDELAVAEYLQRVAAPGTVVLCEGVNLRRLLLGVSGLRVPHAPEFYASSFLSRRDLDLRTQEHQAFWQSWALDVFRRDLANKYQVDYVVATRPLPDTRPKFQRAGYFVYDVASSSAPKRATAPRARSE